MLFSENPNRKCCVTDSACTCHKEAVPKHTHFFPPLDPILVMLYIFVSAFCIKQSKNLEIHNSELPDFKVLPSLQTTFLVRAAKCARQNSPVSVHSEGGTNYTSTDYW